MSIYIGNAFSLQMVDLKAHNFIETAPFTVEKVKQYFDDGLEIISCIGHQDLANVVSNILKEDIKSNRINVKLLPDDILIVAQLTGGRLPEGATTLPDGFKIEFVGVRVISKKL